MSKHDPPETDLSAAGEFEDAVLTAAELARLLRVNVKTVYEGFHAGELPGMQIGSRIRFSRAEVLALLRQGRVVPNRKGRR